MNVLVACEYSGVVRNEFEKLGHIAWSCDLLPTEIPGNHYQGNIFDILYDNKWDLIIAHPPCTDLAVSGARWFKEKQKTGGQQKSGEFITFKSGKKMSKWMADSYGNGHVRSKTFPGIAEAMAKQWGIDFSKI